jgi:hypothetical protein
MSQEEVIHNDGLLYAMCLLIDDLGYFLWDQKRYFCGYLTINLFVHTY